MANQDFNLTDFDPPTRHAKIQIFANKIPANTNFCEYNRVITQIFANKNKADDVDAIIYAE